VDGQGELTLLSCSSNLGELVLVPSETVLVPFEMVLVPSETGDAAESAHREIHNQHRCPLQSNRFSWGGFSACSKKKGSTSGCPCARVARLNCRSNISCILDVFFFALFSGRKGEKEKQTWFKVQWPLAGCSALA